MGIFVSHQSSYFHIFQAGAGIWLCKVSLRCVYVFSLGQRSRCVLRYAIFKRVDTKFESFSVFFLKERVGVVHNLHV